MSRESLIGTIRTVRRLEKSIPQVKWYRMELVLMSLFINIFALGLPIFILQVYDRVLPSLGLTTMQFLVVGLIVVMLLDFLLKTIRAAMTTYTGARFEHLARVSAVDHILRTPQDVYEKDTPGVYLDKVNAIGVVKDFYSSQLGTLMIDLPFAFFFLGMIWLLGGIMVAVPIALLTMFFILAVIIGGNLRRAVDNRSQVDNKKYDFLIEIMNGIHTVKAQAFKNLLQRRFETIQELSARTVRSVAMQSSIAQGLGSTFGQLNMASVIGIGAILVIDGSLTAGELAACTLLSGRAMQPLQSAMGLWTSFQTIRVACNNAIEVLELPAESDEGLPEFEKINGAIEFKNVSFGEQGTGGTYIKNVSLRVEPGTIIGIDGDNSSGNSTLLKLLVGLIRPREGQVLVDGHDISQFQSVSYRQQMAFLASDADVYTGSILDNMTYFRGGKYIRKAMKLSKDLGLDEEIKRLPEGYSTQVGDGAGGILPAGFVQRITIIRAMVDDPRIVLFDRANEGLDSNSDKILLEFLKSLRGKATVILVSARPSWLRVADRQYVMSYGEIREKDTATSTPQLPPLGAASTSSAMPAPAQSAKPAPAATGPSIDSNVTSTPPRTQPTPPIQQPPKPAATKPDTLPIVTKPEEKITQKIAPTPEPTTPPARPVGRQPAPPPGRPAGSAPLANPIPKPPVQQQRQPEPPTSKNTEPAVQSQATPRTNPPARSPSAAPKPVPKPKGAAAKQSETVTDDESARPASPPTSSPPNVSKQRARTPHKPFAEPTPAKPSTGKPAAATRSAQNPTEARRDSAPVSKPAPTARSATSNRPSPPQPATTASNAATPSPNNVSASRAAASPVRPKPAARRTPQAKSAVLPTPPRQRAAPPPKPTAIAKPPAPKAPVPEPKAAASPRLTTNPTTSQTAPKQTAQPRPAAPVPTKPAGSPSKNQVTRAGQPRAAATLRPAAPQRPKNKAVLRPQPPQAKRPPLTEGAE
jgi:ATP-binding cassette subfamily C protein LapB